MSLFIAISSCPRGNAGQWLKRMGDSFSTYGGVLFLRYASDMGHVFYFPNYKPHGRR